MFKRKNEFRERLLKEQEEVRKRRNERIQKEQLEEIAKRRHQKNLEYCKRVCAEYKRKEQAKEIFRVLDLI